MKMRGAPASTAQWIQSAFYLSQGLVDELDIQDPGAWETEVLPEKPLVGTGLSFELG